MQLSIYQICLCQLVIQNFLFPFYMKTETPDILNFRRTDRGRERKNKLYDWNNFQSRFIIRDGQGLKMTRCIVFEF